MALPHGDVGRIVNSFVSVRHQDAVKWQRDFRGRLCANRKPLPFVEQLCGIIYLIATKHLNLKYIHGIRLPDWRRILSLTRLISPEERHKLSGGGVPTSWYPQTSLPRLMRCYSGLPVGTNNYIVETPDPLPWELCENACCRSKSRDAHRRRVVRRRRDAFLYLSHRL